jgi:hypothetical protein
MNFQDRVKKLAQEEISFAQIKFNEKFHKWWTWSQFLATINLFKVRKRGASMTLQPSESNTGNTLSVISIVLGGIGFLLFPIVLGPIAIILAIVAKNKKEKLANPALIVSIVATVLGGILGALVGAALFS